MIYLDWKGDYTSLYICQNSQIVHFNLMHFIIGKWYLTKIYLKIDKNAWVVEKALKGLFILQFRYVLNLLVLWQE